MVIAFFAQFREPAVLGFGDVRLSSYWAWPWGGRASSYVILGFSRRISWSDHGHHVDRHEENESRPTDTFWMFLSLGAAVAIYPVRNC